QRVQQRQILGNHVVVGQRVGHRRRQLNGVGELAGLRIQIGDVVEEDAQECVEGGQEIDWVLGEVGEAVVFVGVDVGRVEIGRCRAVERDAQARDRRVRAGGEGEALQQGA